jgi:hypothetical protein
MEVIEIISNYIDKTQNLIIVEFKTTEDDDDMVREDIIEYSFYEEFGYDNKDVFGLFTEDEDDNDEWDNDEYDFITDESNLMSFLNEYYVVYSNKLPKAQFR